MTKIMKLDVDYKKQISEVLELAAVHDLDAHFTELNRDGPIYNAACSFKLTVGRFVGEASATTEIEAKAQAAQQVLPELRLLPLPMIKEEINQKKEKKLGKDAPKFQPTANPICCLNDLVFAMRAKRPEYNLVHVDKTTEQCIYHIQVTVANDTVTGQGSSQKEAKRNAAALILNGFGYEFPVSFVKPDSTTVSQQVSGAEDTIEFVPEKSLMGDVAPEVSHNAGNAIESERTEVSFREAPEAEDSTQTNTDISPVTSEEASSESPRMEDTEQNDSVCPSEDPDIICKEQSVEASINSPQFLVDNSPLETVAQNTQCDMSINKFTEMVSVESVTSSIRPSSIHEEQTSTAPETGSGLAENNTAELQFGSTFSHALTHALVMKIFKKNRVYRYEECNAIVNRLENRIKDQLIVGPDADISQGKLKKIGKKAGKHLRMEYSSLDHLLQAALKPEDAEFEALVLKHVNIELRAFQNRPKSAMSRFFSALRRTFNFH